MNKPVSPISSLSLRLPKADGAIETYRLAASRSFPAKLEGAKGVQLAECALQSWKERRWIDVAPIKV